MRILVLGAGALGGVIAGKLTAAGLTITALETNPAHAEVCRAPGITVDLPDGSVLVTPIDIVASVNDLTGHYDYGLITLKAPNVRVAVAPVVEVGAVSTFVSLGNGLIQEVIADLVGDRLLVGTVSWGATFLGAGHVRQTTIAPFAIGDPHGQLGIELERVLPVLAHVAPAHGTTNIDGQIWSKLLLNSSLSGLGTVAGALYRDVVASPVGRKLVIDTWSEGAAVAAAAGVHLDSVAGIEAGDLVVRGEDDYDRAGQVLNRLMESLGATKASMLQDLERGIETEVDVINGAVAREGRRLGVPTPFNDLIVEMIRHCQTGQLRPSMTHLTRCRPDDH